MHNVGNILNSINTSVQTMANVLQTTSIEKYQKANEILAENMGDYKTYFSTDPKAEKLLSYYLMLETELTNEYQVLQANVERLTSLVSSVTDVVNSQRDFTGRSLISSDLPLEDIVDEALSMMHNIIHTNNVEIVKSFQPIPMIELQKSKLIHIIVNLIRNSVESMIESEVTQKRIIISITSDEKNVYLSLKDNGMGIPPENLIKIFNHGFTTKKTGYGFGLHSCANYMDEMKGSIRAESDGFENGATFVLEFPIYTQQNSKLKPN